jgi:hypothetical protein
MFEFPLVPAQATQLSLQLSTSNAGFPLPRE